MLKKTITYTDFNNVERTEDFYFNFTEAELINLQLENSGDITDMLMTLVKAVDMPKMAKIFRQLILDSYGEKSQDGKRFIKVDKEGYKLSTAFEQTPAYNILYMELINDANSAAAFVNGIMPNKKLSKEQLEAHPELVQMLKDNNVSLPVE